MFRFHRGLFGLETTQPTKTTDATISRDINEGDFHSGTAGYSVNTLYTDTQYGSGWVQDADWAEGAQ